MVSDGLSDFVLQCVWPILDDSLTRSELIAEALPLVEGMAAKRDAQVTGPPMWRILPAEAVLGWESYPGSVLIARAPAARVEKVRPWRPSSDVDEVKVRLALDGGLPAGTSLGSAERVAATRVGATKLDLTDRQVAARIRCTSRSVQRIRSTWGIPAAEPGSWVRKSVVARAKRRRNPRDHARRGEVNPRDGSVRMVTMPGHVKGRAKRKIGGEKVKVLYVEGVAEELIDYLDRSAALLGISRAAFVELYLRHDIQACQSGGQQPGQETPDWVRDQVAEKQLPLEMKKSA